MPVKLWVLTVEYNEYDQHGGYFVAAWTSKPTVEQLCAAVPSRDWAYWKWVLYSGGGRQGSAGSLEDTWYDLHEIEEGKVLL